MTPADKRTKELNRHRFAKVGAFARLTLITDDVILSEKNRKEIKTTLGMINSILTKAIKTQRKRAKEKTANENKKG